MDEKKINQEFKFKGQMKKKNHECTNFVLEKLSFDVKVGYFYNQKKVNMTFKLKS